MTSGIEPYLLKIGDGVRIEPEVALMTHDGAAWVFRHLAPDLQVYGPIVLEDNCLIGRGALLGPGIRIGRNSVIAPGSLVISDVPADSVAAGIPARAVSMLHADSKQETTVP
ncbi:MAG: acyltransferase [Acidobacteria bacterium]|nr:acyltransferase [Acidobacteriota bacterium]